MLNPVNLLALNVLATTGLCAVLKVAGMAWLPTIFWSWIGGSVITLCCAVMLIVVLERRQNLRIRNGEPISGSKHEIAMWDEDANDEAWGAAVESVNRTPKATAPAQRSAPLNHARRQQS